jgi:hypothetical protein
MLGRGFTDFNQGGLPCEEAFQPGMGACIIKKRENSTTFGQSPGPLQTTKTINVKDRSYTVGGWMECLGGLRPPKHSRITLNCETSNRFTNQEMGNE